MIAIPRGELTVINSQTNQVIKPGDTIQLKLNKMKMVQREDGDYDMVPGEDISTEWTLVKVKDLNTTALVQYKNDQHPDGVEQKFPIVKIDGKRVVYIS